MDTQRPTQPPAPGASLEWELTTGKVEHTHLAKGNNKPHSPAKKKIAFCSENEQRCKDSRSRPPASSLPLTSSGSTVNHDNIAKGKQQHRAGKNQDSGVVSLAFGHEAASDATWRLGGDTQSSCVVL
ncbi:hypothetical protein TREES_T100006368 [Tupaia chinensis]|uniref:Uncharacterized protein n=1 Tax=Tupaia chinensis TaxID=246437 RepID=L9KZ92_TUPCH|nr:hypothetical protein TREES_T100006368 [Tupaia chinensis]